MNTHQTRCLEMFNRVRDYGQFNATHFEAGSFGAELFAEVGSVVSELEASAAGQMSGRGSSRQSTTGRSLARADLRARMNAISLTARSIDIDSPGVGDKFRIPKSANDQRLLATARAFMLDAEPFAKDFIRHELAPTFLKDLGAAVDSFERVLMDTNQAVETRTSAQTNLDGAIRRGLTAVMRLRAVVSNRLSGEKALLAAFEQAARVERTARKPKVAAPKAPEPPSGPSV